MTSLGAEHMTDTSSWDKGKSRLILAVGAAFLAVSLMVAAIGGSAASIDAAKKLDAGKPTIEMSRTSGWG